MYLPVHVASADFPVVRFISVDSVHIGHDLIESVYEWLVGQRFK